MLSYGFSISPYITLTSVSHHLIRKMINAREKTGSHHSLSLGDIHQTPLASSGLDQGLKCRLNYPSEEDKGFENQFRPWRKGWHMLTFENTLEDDEATEDFPSNNELLFPLLWQPVKLPLSSPRVCSLLCICTFSQIIGAGVWINLKESCFTLHRLSLSLSLSLSLEERRINPFICCCLVSLGYHDLGRIARCWGFHLLTF